MISAKQITGFQRDRVVKGEQTVSIWMPLDRVPDPDKNPDDMQVLEWPMQPGDTVLFNYRTAHGAGGNFSDTTRRALSLREDWFPVIWGGE